MIQIDYKISHKAWYAMKASYGRALKAKSMLDAMSIENFVPMSCKQVMVRGRKEMVLSPAIPNLLFINVDMHSLQEVKSRIAFIHNMLSRRDGHDNLLEPIIVPDSEMTQFMGVVNSQSSLDYVDLATTPLSRGTKVRITDGTFKGYEGVLLKIKGVRERRVVVDIVGILGVSVANVTADMVEKI